MRYMYRQRTPTLSALTNVYLHRSELHRRLSVSGSLVRKNKNSLNENEILGLLYSNIPVEVNPSFA
jgi:hypothetical protein